MPKDWQEYQNLVARLFTDLGLECRTNQTLEGIRTSHAVDVYVQTTFLGMNIDWVVECKHWQTRIPKEKVLALRQIVSDLGADRGLMMAESGYQSGALQASHFTNVHLTSLSDLIETCRGDLGISKLRQVYRRIDRDRERYWSLPKDHRIDHDLRPPPIVASGYNGDATIKAIYSCVTNALLDGFPVVYDELLLTLAHYSSGKVRPEDIEERSLVFEEPEALATHLSALLTDLERRLTAAEDALPR